MAEAVIKRSQVGNSTRIGPRLSEVCKTHTHTSMSVYDPFALGTVAPTHGYPYLAECQFF